MDPELNLDSFMKQQSPKTLIFSFNQFYRVYLKNSISSPSNLLITSIDFQKVKTLSWYQKARDADIPADQACLLAMYIRNLESNIDYSGKPQMQVRTLLELMGKSTQTLVEPIYKEINHLVREKTDRRLTVENLTKEKEELESQAEKNGIRYIYLLLLLTTGQFCVFYWTIFQVDWLGWDIMEPLTYTLQLVSAAIAMRYYYKYRTVRGFHEILRNQRDRYINSNLSTKFRYHKIEANLETLKKESRYINKAIQYYKSRQKMV